jgi:hypothetical protein
MKRLFTKIKRTKSPKPPQQPTPLAKPADLAAGPPDSREELDDGGRIPSNEGLVSGRTDPMVPLDEGGMDGSQVLIQEGTDEVQEIPASGASTTRAAIGGTGCPSEWFRLPPWAQHSRGLAFHFLLAEGPGNAGEEAEPAEIPTSMR